jgi:tRNA (cmo5U34)-methyltransferase
MTQWQFNADVASTFVDHARQHIPNYDLVIGKSVDICKKLLTTQSAIIDVGCATGETLGQLYKRGFDNLYGIDSSQAMLDYCDPKLAKYYLSNKFPDQIFDAIICNWTLHFIKNKEQYLENIYKNLNQNGFLILSEKTSNDPVPINFYHRFKSSQGVSEQDIQLKSQSLQGVMFIDDITWYLNTLTNIGFKKIYIIDASYCFTTFFCLKNNIVL